MLIPMLKHHGLFCLWLLLALFVSMAWDSTQPAAAFTPEKTTDAQLIVDFEKIAFGSEFDDKMGRAHKSRAQIIKKWLKPIRYWQEGDPSELARDIMMQQIDQLATLTGINFEPANSKKDSNFYILWVEKKNYHRMADAYFPNNPNFKKRMMQSNCYFVMSFTSSGEITRSIIVVPPNFPKPKLRHCIVEEVSQSMGLINDNLSVIPSMFNDRYVKNSLSWKDKLFLQMLYHPDIPAGARFSDIQDLLAPMVRQLREH